MLTLADYLRSYVQDGDDAFSERGPAVLIEAVDDQETLLRQKPAPVVTETMQIDRSVFSAEALALSEERLGALQDMVDDASGVFPLEKTGNNTSANILIGRGGRNDVIVADDSVSASHAVIRFDGESYAIGDLESANGTFVNRKRIEPDSRKTLRDGDCVRLGGRVMYFLLHDTFVLFVDLRTNRVDLAGG